MHSASEWLKDFQHTITEAKPKTHALRMIIQRQIWSTFEEYQYITEDGKKIKLDRVKLLDDIRKGKMYNDDFVFPNFAVRNTPTTIEVCNRDCLEVAHELKFGKKFNPVVLNMANAHTPGGGYRSGSGAQEENLHRRTNYFQHLEDPQRLYKERTWYYPIPEFGCVYSPNVIVIRGSEKDGYPFIDPFEVCMIASAAYSRPHTRYNKEGVPFIMDDHAEGTRNKIRSILRCGLENGHNAIVLSAFGCGAYRNPPGHIAQLFKEIIDHPEFKDRYHHICFAILDDHNAGKKHNPEGNYKPFLDVFSAQQ